MTRGVSRRLCLLGLVLAGCGDGQRDLMPLQVGKSWTYRVVSGLDRRLEAVKVVRPVAVDGVEGVELNSPLGISRLAWDRNALLAQSTGSLRFRPSLPLLAQNQASQNWKGWVTWLGRDIAATAQTVQKPKTLTLNSRTIDSIESDVVLRLPSRDIRLTTWFESGVGIVRQEQHTGINLDLGMELIEGP